MQEILNFQDCSNETCEVDTAEWSSGDVFYIGRRGTKKMCVSIERLEKILAACKESYKTKIEANKNA